MKNTNSKTEKIRKELELLKKEYLKDEVRESFSKSYELISNTILITTPIIIIAALVSLWIKNYSLPAYGAVAGFVISFLLTFLAGLTHNKLFYMFLMLLLALFDKNHNSSYKNNKI